MPATQPVSLRTFEKIMKIVGNLYTHNFKICKDLRQRLCTAAPFHDGDVVETAVIQAEIQDGEIKIDLSLITLDYYGL